MGMMKMGKMKWASGAMALILATMATPAIAGAEEDFVQLREDVWQSVLDNNPLLATQIGDRRGDGKLGDLSMDAYNSQIAQSKAFQERLNQIDEASIPDALRIDYQLLKRGFESDIAGSAFDHNRYVIFTNRGGWFFWLSSLANRSPFFTGADYESYVSRLEGFAENNRHGIARSRTAVESGLTHACEPMAKFSDRLSDQQIENAEKTQFWAPFSTRPSTISEAEWEALTTRAKTAIEGGVAQGLAAFKEFYDTEYAPHCRTGAPGVAQTPGGDEYYAHLVKSYTTTEMTPAEVHALGLSEVARIRAEMVEVAKEAGFDSREAFIEHLRSDPQYYAKTPDELMKEARALAKEIDGWMPKLFGNLPRQPYTVLPIPAAQAPGNTTAYYERGALAIGQPGIYRVNTTELDQRPLWELPSLGVHEAVPGHHHQLALQQELDVHPLRSNGTFFTAFVEGWGLYSERLGIEMGLYDTPAKQMGRLSYEMWRAARLVVDTGLHSKQWPKQQAVDFMLDNTALSPANIDAEVNRYITWPGQALAYKIGELKIRELRGRAETALGSQFDLRGFHDAVLENGAVPLDVLDTHIDRWIEEQKSET